MDVLSAPSPLPRVSLLEDRTDLMSTYKEPPFPATSFRRGSRDRAHNFEETVRHRRSRPLLMGESEKNLPCRTHLRGIPPDTGTKACPSHVPETFPPYTGRFSGMAWPGSAMIPHSPYGQSPESFWSLLIGGKFRLSPAPHPPGCDLPAPPSGTPSHRAQTST